MNNDQGARAGIDYTVGLPERIPSACMVFRRDGDGEIVYMNQRMLDLMNCKDFDEGMDFTGGTFAGTIYSPDIPSCQAQLRHFFGNEDDSRQEFTDDEDFESQAYEDVCWYRNVRKDEEAIKVYALLRYFNDPDLGDLAYCLVIPFNEITLFDIDILNRLPGIHGFFTYAYERMASLEAEGERLAYFVYLNIASFRRFNVLYGFEEGDSFLRKAAEIIIDAFDGDYVARFSADRFAVFSVADNVLERIEKVHDSIQKIRMGTKIECKAGVYIADIEDPPTPSLACDFAKAACDSIHDNASQFVQVYNNEVAFNIERQQYIIETINRACERGDIKVFYHPQIRTLSGKLCGFEALARWSDPNYGFLNPGDFVPLLEKSNQIHKLDCYVVEEICRKLAVEIEAGHPVVPVSFNLSRVDFMVCDVFQVIEDIVKKYNIPRYLLRAEVTEGVILDDMNLMAEENNRFRNAGYEVWMDDYGTGYSSLMVLKNYKFEVLKIDMDFVQDPSPVSRQILSSTVSMAKKLGMEPLAEGVETEEQEQYLRDIACSRMQGFYFGKPAPYAVAMRNCDARGIEIEDREQSEYYDAVSLVDIQNDNPLYILEDDGKNLSILADNDACKRLWYGVGYENNAFDKTKTQAIYDDDVVRRIRKFIDENEWHVGDDPKPLALVDRGHSIYDTFSLIAETKGKRAFLVNIRDVTA
ncbi:MAG: EAL domain-containing protein [Coriobacteriales bacterium]|jgi:EAL domain-containing protein (putative c-di-GMP-specific phosphodiesterase class I)/GGDEF domain-containing protein